MDRKRARARAGAEGGAEEEGGRVLLYIKNYMIELLALVSIIGTTEGVIACSTVFLLPNLYRRKKGSKTCENILLPQDSFLFSYITFFSDESLKL